MTRLRAENTRLARENGSLRGDINDLNEKLDRANATNLELKATQLDQTGLLWDNARKKQQLRKVKAENRVLKWRKAGSAPIDPLQDILHPLPFEIQELIHIQVLRMDRPIDLNDVCAFITSVPTVADKVFIAPVLRLKYLPTFLKCNVAREDVFAESDPIIECYKTEHEEDISASTCFRSVRLLVGVDQLKDPAESGFPTLDRSLVRLLKLSNLQHLEFVIKFGFLDTYHEICDASTALEKSGCLRAFRALRSVKTMVVKPQVGSAGLLNRRARFREYAWFKEAASVIFEVMKESCPQCSVVTDCPGTSLEPTTATSADVADPDPTDT